MGEGKEEQSEEARGGISKRRSEVEHSRDGKRPRLAPAPSKRKKKKKHLYVALDDWALGYTIHKFDLGPDAGEHAYPGLRFKVTPGGACFAAMGTKILALTRGEAPVRAYNLHKVGKSIAPPLPVPAQRHSASSRHIAVDVGSKLYLLTCHNTNCPPHQRQHSLVAMSLTATGGWSWESVSPPPPFQIAHKVISYALHPDGRTIFMSTIRAFFGGLPTGTYSFDTKDCLWRWHGEWGLPFQDRGYFSAELDSWIGYTKDGYIRCCKVVSPTTDTMLPPDQVMVRKMPIKHGELHAASNLVCMGTNKFCIVQTLAREARPGVLIDNHLLRLTMFSLKRNEEGQPKAIIHKPIRTYIVPHYLYNHPQAFWV